MGRFLWYGFLIALSVLAAIWVADRPGTVLIHWMGREVSLSVGVGLLILLLFLVVGIFTYSLLRGLVRSPGNLKRTYRNNKRSRGYKALTLGMVAVAAGDPDEARKQSKKADVLLNEPPLTMLLSAQAAQLNGDEEAARRYFIQMLENTETAFLGLRGLVNQAIINGDHKEAQKLTYRAKKLRPDSRWVFDQLYLLETDKNHYSLALRALKEAQARKLLPKPESKHKQALVFTQIALEHEEKGKIEYALTCATRAVNRAPDLIAAQIVQARLLVATNQFRKAAASIEKIWKTDPHPDFLSIYFEARNADTPIKRYKAGVKLCNLNPDHFISLITRAEVALAADFWGEARKFLEQAENIHKSEKIYKLLAEVERAEGGTQQAIYAFLEKAAAVSQESIWICESCATVHKEWQMRCGSCGVVDSLGWRAEAIVDQPL